MSTCRGQPAGKKKKGERNVLECHQRRVALERLSDGARTLVVDDVVVEAARVLEDERRKK